MNGDPDLEALHRRSTAPADRTGCPSAEALFSLVGPAASLAPEAPTERERLVDHVAACSSCAEELRLMRSLGPWSESLAQRLTAAGEAPGVPPPRPRPHPARRTRLRPLALAAVLAAALVGGAVLLRQNLPLLPVADETGEVERGAAPAGLSPVPDSVLGGPPAMLRWPPQAGAVHYRVKVYDEQANLLWESPPSRQPRAPLPPAVRNGLHPGAAYFWVVEVEGPVQRRQLGAFWFRLAGLGHGYKDEDTLSLRSPDGPRRLRPSGRASLPDGSGS